MLKKFNALSCVALLSLSAGCIFGGGSDGSEPDAGSPNNTLDGAVAACGNGLIEAGETCDGDCPTSCNDDDVCTEDRQTGSAATCDVVCENEPLLDCGVDMGTDMPAPVDMNTSADAGMRGDMASPDMATTVDMSSLDGGAADMGQPLQGFVLFDDALAPNLTFAGFGQSTNTIAPTRLESFSGTSSLAVPVPATGFTGGAYLSGSAVDLAGYDALRFMVKASKSASIDVVGFGRTAGSTERAVAQRSIGVSTTWKEVFVPIPVASRVNDVTGLFYFTENADEGAYEIYLDEIAFVNVGPGDLANQTGELNTVMVTLVPNQTVTVDGTQMSVDVLGAAQTFLVAPYYFDWSSTDGSVATVNSIGEVTTVAVGRAEISGTLDGVAADGGLAVEVVDTPQTAAPTPTTPSNRVVAAVYSDAYTEVTNNTLGTSFGDPLVNSTQAEVLIGGNNTLLYEALGFMAIVLDGPNSLDISSATTMHVDVWTPNTDAFGIKLVDFGPNNMFDGVGQGDDSEYQIDLSAPGDFRRGQWASFDIPLSTFDIGLTSRANIAQIIFATNANPDATSIYVDNLYFY